MGDFLEKDRKMSKKYPIYQEDSLPPGMYLGLFHGFKNEEEREAAQDWGEKGAAIGPLAYVHTTYASDVKIRFKDSLDASKYGLETEEMFDLENGLIKFDGMEYGDWTVFYVEHEGAENE